METSAILSADVLDIIFEGKNKSYGAYELRKSYQRRMILSITVMISLVLLSLTGFLFANNNKKLLARELIIPPDIDLGKVDPIKKVDPLPLPKPVEPVASKPLKTIKNLVPTIVPNELVDPEDKVPENASMDDAAIGASNSAGEGMQGDVAPPTGKGEGTGVVEPPVKADAGDERFMPIEIESIYPGGTPAWQRFLNKTLHYPKEAADNGTTGTVVVQFIVDVDGRVSNVEAISGPEELRSEAERVIRKSGKWEPAIQNGRKVKSHKKQPITFQLLDQ